MKTVAIITLLYIDK